MKVNQIVDGFYEYNEPYFDVDLLDADDLYAIQEIATHNVLPLFLGKMINKPIDKNNHTIDAVRYATYSVLSKPNFGKYAIQ